MSKKVNPIAVGVFVAGAVGLLLTALIVLGSGKIFEKRGRLVVYFKSSANGLDEGSDVLLGGVKIGSVVKMQVQFDPETREKVIPVVIEISANRIAALTIDEKYTQDWILSKDSLEWAIEQEGLRARLITKSVLTGQLFVDLDFFPDDPESYRFPGEPIDGLPQIPTTKNEIERVLDSIAEGVQKLGAVDFVQMIEKIDSLITNLDTKVSEFDSKLIGERAMETLEKADSAFDSIESVFTDERLTNAIANIDAAAAELQTLIANIDEENLNTTIAEAGKAVKKAGDAMENIKTAAVNIAGVASPDAATAVRLNRTLASIAEASRSIEELADYLRRNPNSILAGKKNP